MEESIRDLVHAAVLAMEAMAVLVIVVGLVIGLVRFGRDAASRAHRSETYHRFKSWMGRTLLLGLEILVAADVVNTVALEPTLNNVLALGLLVVIRTFLGWSLVLEIEGRWPWQQPAAPVSSTPAAGRL